MELEQAGQSEAANAQDWTALVAVGAGLLRAAVRADDVQGPRVHVERLYIYMHRL